MFIIIIHLCFLLRYGFFLGFLGLRRLLFPRFWLWFWLLDHYVLPCSKGLYLIEPVTARQIEMSYLELLRLDAKSLLLSICPCYCYPLNDDEPGGMINLCYLAPFSLPGSAYDLDHVSHYNWERPYSVFFPQILAERHFHLSVHMITLNYN
ncbi:hypothetical protein [Thermoplasma acidophilum]|uniref:Uncharacterized protein n=1 Tax=Thermoplasma acidophilum (strain ATCC 25905 / DSM 1728 / JCM 9062 / NBRC 15155 / AMRC-C165) TaxID=273075 RepID=Q9HIS0_THEAC|nr:hypothetical protein [Thermoplasma acidophilum]